MSLSVETYALCKKYTNKAITEAATELEWKQVIVDELPEVGEKQTMYFVPNETGSYTEYLWVTDLERFEEVGSTEIIAYDDELSDESENAVQNKVVKAAVDTKVDKVTGKGLSTNDYTTEEKTKLAGIEAGAEVNQNTFANVNVEGTTIAASSKQDTFGIVSGDNVDLEVSGKNITVSAVDTKYTTETSTQTILTSFTPGDLPTLGTEISADDITAWSTGTQPVFEIENNHILKITNGTLPSLSYTPRSIPNVTSVGTASSAGSGSMTYVTGLIDLSTLVKKYPLPYGLGSGYGYPDDIDIETALTAVHNKHHTIFPDPSSGQYYSHNVTTIYDIPQDKSYITFFCVQNGFIFKRGTGSENYPGLRYTPELVLTDDNNFPRLWKYTFATGTITELTSQDAARLINIPNYLEQVDEISYLPKNKFIKGYPIWFYNNIDVYENNTENLLFTYFE